MQDNDCNELIIDSVTVPGARGRIGMCSCPGSRRAQSLDYDPTLHLLEDLRSIGRFNARILVTLMEERELDNIGVHTLPIEARRLGLTWMHLPIVDMSVPTTAFERRWDSAGAELRDTLLGGEHIVLHCWAGLGRTGTIAAKLLVEFGLDPLEATYQVRAARAGAIQSRAQEKYVKKLKAGVVRSPQACQGNSE